MAPPPADTEEVRTARGRCNEMERELLSEFPDSAPAIRTEEQSPFPCRAEHYAVYEWDSAYLVEVWNFEYGDDGLVSYAHQVLEPDLGEDSPYEKIWLTRNAYGHVVSVTRRDASGYPLGTSEPDDRHYAIDLVYDTAGALIEVDSECACPVTGDPVRKCVLPGSYTDTLSYDDEGRLAFRERDHGRNGDINSVWTYHHTPSGRLSGYEIDGPTNVGASTSHEPDGEPNRSVQLHYDQDSHLSHEVWFGGAGALSRVVFHSVDEDGVLVSTCIDESGLNFPDFVIRYRFTCGR